MSARAGGDEALMSLQEDGLVVLAVVSWGAAPVQTGGRAAERKYVDVIVHLSPASELWASGDAHTSMSQALMSNRLMHAPFSEALHYSSLAMWP